MGEQEVLKDLGFRAERAIGVKGCRDMERPVRARRWDPAVLEGAAFKSLHFRLRCASGKTTRSLGAKSEQACACTPGTYLSYGGECTPCHVAREGDLGIACPKVGGRPQLMPGYHSTPLGERVSGNQTQVEYAPLEEISVFLCTLYEADADRHRQICPGGDFGWCYDRAAPFVTESVCKRFFLSISVSARPLPGFTRNAR